MTQLRCARTGDAYLSGLKGPAPAGARESMDELRPDESRAYRNENGGQKCHRPKRPLRRPLKRTRLANQCHPKREPEQDADKEHQHGAASAVVRPNGDSEFAIPPKMCPPDSRVGNV
jgi:hypothetical protein